MLGICVLICGCVANSTTDNTSTGNTTDDMQVHDTAVPSIAAPEVASPVPTANPTVRPSPTPAVPNNSVKTHSDFAPGLPPAVAFTHVPAYNSLDTLQGKVTGVDPAAYKLAIFVNWYGWWNAPSGDAPLTTIDADGSWECNLSSTVMGLNASSIDAFIVPAGFTVPIASGRYGLPGELKESAIACNEVNRPVPGE